MAFNYTGPEPLATVFGLDMTIIAPLARQDIVTVGELVRALPHIEQGEVPGRYAILEDWVKEHTQERTDHA